jgi:hypothetical protein
MREKPQPFHGGEQVLEAITKAFLCDNFFCLGGSVDLWEIYPVASLFTRVV